VFAVVDVGSEEFQEAQRRAFAGGGNEDRGNVSGEGTSCFMWISIFGIV